MKRYAYDLHIHTALSPCASDDMTPQNIVQMAKLKGLDLIAVTDHNSAANVQSVMRASKQLDGPLIVPGIEIETQEEIHVLALFETVDGAEACSEALGFLRFKLKNRPDIYGRQLRLTADDQIASEEENLLVVATDLGVYDLPAFVAAFNGVSLPAHIFRPSHGILNVLGEINDDMRFAAVEDTADPPDFRCAEYEKRGYTVLHNSDAHDLGLIAERGEHNTIGLPSLSTVALIERLRNRA